MVGQCQTLQRDFIYHAQRSGKATKTESLERMNIANIFGSIGFIRRLFYIFKDNSSAHSLQRRLVMLFHSMAILSDRFRLKSTDPIGTRKSGAPPALSPEEEQIVVDWVLETARMGQPPSWKRLSIAVKEMLDRSGHTKVFANNNMPSSGWLRAFKKRHPNLSPTKSDEISVPDTITKEDIKKWFIELQTHLKEEGLDPKLFLQPQNGNRIYNSEEVVVMLQGEDRLSKVLTQKGKRNVPKFCSPGRKMITVMTCISASGSYLRPFVVFEGRKIPLQQLLQHVDPSFFDVGFSKRGGIDHELFSVWVEGLISYLDFHNVQRPVLLLLDSHTCHINLHTCEIAKEAGLIMHLLPAQANHLMQPVDVGIFKTLKTAYRESVDHFMPTHGPAINKKHFPLVFVNAWRNAAIKENAISGFRDAGLVPLNLEMIDTTKIPARPRPSAANIRTFKDRAPGRPLHKGGRPPKRTPRPPGNEYIRGLSDALDHIIHNFVSDKVRPIYEQWILEEKSCTPDPVFYIWGSLKTLIEENTKKQVKCEQVLSNQYNSAKSTLPHPPLAHSQPSSSFHSHDKSNVGVLSSHVHVPNNTVAQLQQQHHRDHLLPRNSITSPNPGTADKVSSSRERPYVYGHRDLLQPATQQSPHSASSTYTPQTMTTQTMSWDPNNMQPTQQHNFNRYFGGQQPQHQLEGLHNHTTIAAPATTDMGLHRPTIQHPTMIVQHAGTYYSNNRNKDMGVKDMNNDMGNKSGIKRQWLDEKEDLDNTKGLAEGTSHTDKDSRTDDDSCNVYDGTDSSNYSVRIGMCMQEVVPQDLCQLQYQED